MEGKCRWQRGCVPSTEQGREPGAMSKGILTQPQCLCPSIRAWHLPGTVGIKFILEKAKGNTPSTGRGRETPHTLFITPAENPGLRLSWPCLLGNLDWLGWQNQVFLGVSAQGTRLGVEIEKASEDRDPKKVVTESSLQTISQTLSGTYYWQL